MGNGDYEHFSMPLIFLSQMFLSSLPLRKLSDFLAFFRGRKSP